MDRGPSQLVACGVPSVPQRPGTARPARLARERGCEPYLAIRIQPREPAPVLGRRKHRKNVPEVSSLSVAFVLWVDGSRRLPAGLFLSVACPIKTGSGTVPFLSNSCMLGVTLPNASLGQATGNPGSGVGDGRIFPKCRPRGFNTTAVVTITETQRSPATQWRPADRCPWFTSNDRKWEALSPGADALLEFFL